MLVLNEANNCKIRPKNGGFEFILLNANVNPSLMRQQNRSSQLQIFSYAIIGKYLISVIELQNSQLVVLPDEFGLRSKYTLNLKFSNELSRNPIAKRNEKEYFRILKIAVFAINTVKRQCNGIF